MKNIYRILLIATGLWAMHLPTAGPLFSVELVFKDPQYSFQSLRALGYTVSGGADVGEVLKTIYAIRGGTTKAGSGNG